MANQMFSSISSQRLRWFSVLAFVAGFFSAGFFSEAFHHLPSLLGKQCKRTPAPSLLRDQPAPDLLCPPANFLRDS